MQLRGFKGVPHPLFRGGYTEKDAFCVVEIMGCLPSEYSAINLVKMHKAVLELCH